MNGETRQYVGDIEPLIEYVRTLQKGTGPEQVEQEPPKQFMGFVKYWMHPRKDLQYWVSTMREGDPPADGDWVQGFPHCHDWGLEALTMICYLTPGGELVVFRGPGQADPFTITPTPGLCAFVDGETWHGVRPTTGPGDRLAIIVTGGRNEREDAGTGGEIRFRSCQPNAWPDPCCHRRRRRSWPPGW